MKKQVSKMTDKELDDFFKKLSSDPEIPYNSQDWDRFEKRMAGNKKVARPVNGFKWYLLGPLFIAGLLFTVWMAVSDGPFKTGDETPLLSASSLLLTELDLYDDYRIKILAKKMPSMKYVKNNNEQTADASIKNRSQVLTSDSFPKEDLPESTAKPIYLKWDSDSKWNLFEKFNRISPVENNTGIHKGSGIKFAPSEPFIHHQNMALGIMLSPDFSAIQFDHFPAFGRSIGVRLDYSISRRWGFSVGALHGQKRYRGGEGYWEGYDTSHQAMIGDCWLIEIPINLKYYPISKSKNRWFISSGLSSYIMLKEKYSLTYENYSGNSYTQEMEINGDNQHVFGVWNIGMGYEQKLSKKFTIQAEPYFRVPLVGIGAGNLDLKSIGIFFGINYYPSNQILKF
ncbi:outer membrane beta-barrel protein [Cyclobacterium jeungdonense]|uniref:Outer membrane beta-barrel protein n=1 Tax=Cyclobacterium jeungdonense TaxID=708087 RepID=A0ABT8CA84_9BACT|nr:outer membrane beta-barrel protein [Cyclobacterium jeungdonense]MDN3688904.1 outer membrane beta-barrel protein [Cyclobacterium jeungdonense]